MIFRVSGTEVFLVGSIHLVPSGVVLSLDRQRSLVETAQEVIFESDLDHPPLPACGRFEVGRLSDFLTRELYDGVSALAKAVQFEEPVDAIKPWLLGIILCIRLQMRSEAVVGGVDRVLWDHARERSKPISVLERAELFEKIDQAPVAEAVVALELIVAAPDEPVIQLQKIYRAWLEGNQNALDEALSRMSRLAPTIYRCIFEDRNRLWFPVLLKAIRERRRAVFVIGCGHIAHGSASMRILLEEAGFSLEAVQ